MNQRLPQRYFAELNVQFGIEIDVAAFDESMNVGVDCPINAQAEWEPPTPAQTGVFSAYS